MNSAVSDRRALAVLALVGAAVGVAVWLVPASHHIVSWQSGVPGRVALVASPWWLAVAIALGVAFAVGGAWWRWSGDRPLRSAAYLAAPLLLLWRWAVPYLPWLPSQLPLLVGVGGPDPLAGLDARACRLRPERHRIGCVATSDPVVARPPSRVRGEPRRVPGRRTVREADAGVRRATSPTTSC